MTNGGWMDGRTDGRMRAGDETDVGMGGWEVG